MNYVLITPAKNEASFIEKTIQSVIEQTLLPLKWVIVNDGSSDGTEEIVRKHIGRNEWMELLSLPTRNERNFAGKVHAFNEGYSRLRGTDYQIIGNLDADVSFEADYLSFLVGKFVENPRLGVGGTPFREGTFQYDYRFTSIDHVSGACQLFRRECFESIGRYKPIKGGGIDLVAEISARMHGWQTRSFPDRVFVHSRPVRTGTHKGLASPFLGGKKDYMLGAHPLWEVFRSIYQMKNRPLVIGGLARLLGFYFFMLSGTPKSMPLEMVEFRGKEQLARLKNLFRRWRFWRG